MKKLTLIPTGWPCSLEECPPGHFLFDEKYVGFKTEYRTSEGTIEAYNEAGEAHSGRHCPDEVIVQPLEPKWEEE